MSTLSRYLRHAAAVTTGLNGLTSVDNPLGAGRMTAVLANNGAHLAEQNHLRTLRTHAGIRNFFAASPTLVTTAPTVYDVPWRTSQKDGSCCIDLGTHYVWALPGGRLPKLRLSFATQVDGGNTLGWLFGVSPGSAGPLAADVVADVTTSATWDATSAVLLLDAARHLRLVSEVPMNGIVEPAADERGDLYEFRGFFGAYNSSGSNTAGQLANVVGLSLRTEFP